MLIDAILGAMSEVTLAKGYVLVCNRHIRTLERAAQVCQAIDDALLRGKVDRVLFDTRETEAPAEDVRTAMWEWVSARRHHCRCAIVAQSELTQVSGNMTARSFKAPLRSFGDLEEAERWLLED